MMLIELELLHASNAKYFVCFVLEKWRPRIRCMRTCMASVKYCRHKIYHNIPHQQLRTQALGATRHRATNRTRLLRWLAHRTTRRRLDSSSSSSSSRSLWLMVRLKWSMFSLSSLSLEQSCTHVAFCGVWTLSSDWSPTSSPVSSYVWRFAVWVGWAITSSDKNNLA